MRQTEPTQRIDTHQHIVPPAYAAWLAARGLNAGGRAIPHWSVDGALELMHGAGIASAILSLSTPGVHLGDDAEARDKAREVNEFAAGVARSDSARFGYFATLTLPDVPNIERVHVAITELLFSVHDESDD